MIEIQVAYATTNKQKVISLTMPENSTIGHAIDKSKILDYFKISLDDHFTGIFSKRKPLDTVLKNGDRVEIYRPIKKPKDKRY